MPEQRNEVRRTDDNDSLIAVLSKEIDFVREQLAMHINDQKSDFEKLYKKIDDLSKIVTSRLPLWATFMFSFLTLILGSFVTIIFGLLKMR